MTFPLKYKVKRKDKQKIEGDQKYLINEFVFRKETGDQYTLFNGRTLFANVKLVRFLIDPENEGYFKLSEFPGELRDKARNLGQIFLSKKFLTKEK